MVFFADQTWTSCIFPAEDDDIHCVHVTAIRLLLCRGPVGFASPRRIVNMITHDHQVLEMVSHWWCISDAVGHTNIIPLCCKPMISRNQVPMCHHVLSPRLCTGLLLYSSHILLYFFDWFRNCCRLPQPPHQHTPVGYPRHSLSRALGSLGMWPCRKLHRYERPCATARRKKLWPLGSR